MAQTILEFEHDGDTVSYTLQGRVDLAAEIAAWEGRTPAARVRIEETWEEDPEASHENGPEGHLDPADARGILAGHLDPWTLEDLTIGT